MDIKQQLELDNVISAQSINKKFATKSGKLTVLSDINFTVPRGSLTIIYGPSGSGKTTLLNILSGLEPPTTGKLIVNNKDLYRLSSDQRSSFRAKNMGIVQQSNYWVKSLNVLENVAMPLYLSGQTKQESLKRAQASLDQVDLGQFAHSRPTVLSGGQQQRVSMARALVAGSGIIMADEPTGNLDSKSGKMIIDLLLKFKEEMNRTVILITHNIEYLPISDQQLYVTDGRVMQSKRGQKMPTAIKDSLQTQINELSKMEKG